MEEIEDKEQGGKGGPQESPAETAPAPEADPLAEIQRQADQYKDLYLRKAAEFENYKKRIENESATLIKYANEDLIASILPVLDDLERSLKLSKDKREFESLYRGVELIHQKFTKILEGLGVKTLVTVGKEFNVAYHDALMQMPKEGIPSHTVIEEVEKGYTLGDKVIRHAKVIVSAVPDGGAGASTGDNTKGTEQA